MCKRKHSLYVYNKALENSSDLTLCFPTGGQLAISKHAQEGVQSQQSVSFNIAILVIKPRNKPSVAPKVQHCRLVLAKTPYSNNFLLIILFQNMVTYTSMLLNP